LSEEEIFRKAFAMTHHPAFQAQGADIRDSENTAQLHDGTIDLQLEREASALAAIMLATPAGLLGLSLNMFIFGLGIYLGCLYTGESIAGFGKGGSLGMLIFYLLAAAVGTFMYTFPSLLKLSEQHDAKKMAGMTAQLEVLNHRIRGYEQQQNEGADLGRLQPPVTNLQSEASQETGAR
jgi:hypothetical protein